MSEGTATPLCRDLAGGLENDCSEREQKPVSRDRQNGGPGYTDAYEVPTDETKRAGISMGYCTVDDLPKHEENRAEEQKPKRRDPVEVRLSGIHGWLDRVDDTLGSDRAQRYEE